MRIFRDEARAMRFGKRVSFFVPVVGSSGSSEVRLDGTLYHKWEWLHDEKWLEVFVHATGEGVDLVRSQPAPIRHPTLHPVCGPDTKGYCCAGNVGGPDEAQGRTRAKRADDQAVL